MRSLFHFAALFTGLVAYTSASASCECDQVQIEQYGERKQCTVYPRGGQLNDVPNILCAFSTCGRDGRIVFPSSAKYWIASKLNPTVSNVEIDWRGTWIMSDNITTWNETGHTYPIAFQNHAASFILSGDGISIDGHGTGGIDGNGDAWYDHDAGNTTPGRPMPFVFWNVSQVTVKNFEVRQPPLWSLNIMNGTDMWFENITCNATARNAPPGKNWVQNTDGFDTMDVHNVHLSNFVYQGGDDCTAIKPRSYNVFVRNATCHGGNGMAIGSLGQYLVDSSVANVVFDNVTVIRRNEDLTNSAYIKTWIGVPLPQSSYESGGVPRGGGWGVVRNILFANFRVFGADAGPSITQDSGDDGHHGGTSKMEISNIAFVNFTGYLSGHRGVAGESVSCSKVHECYNIDYKNVTLAVSQNNTRSTGGKCQYVEKGGVHGLVGVGCG